MSPYSVYSIQVYYSVEDECFIALSPEWPGLSTFGKTRTLALGEFEVLLNEIVDMYLREGKDFLSAYFDEGSDMPEALIIGEDEIKKFPLMP